MPRRSTEWADASALWVTVAGWANAARSRFGSACVVTPGTVSTPEEVLDFTSQGGARRRGHWTRAIPAIARTALNDAKRARLGRRFSDLDENAAWRGDTFAFVWQHHDLFHTTGLRLAERHNCPLVSFVHAPQVWEARQWGVCRPGWGHVLERHGERPQLQASDVVACVSHEVAYAIRQRLDVPDERIIVSPMAVDATRFSPSRSSNNARRALGLENSFIVGWSGTFRRFHGLESVVEAFARLHAQDERAELLLVGDGSQRNEIERLVRARGVHSSVRFAGSIHPLEMPAYVAAMDVAVVSALPNSGFHYSPLKLREYLSCGRPVVAPRIGELPRLANDGVALLLYEPGDPADLAAQIGRIQQDPVLAGRLGVAGREHVLKTGTWEVRLQELLASPPFSAASHRLGIHIG
jgi:glycosyltransferase involved in cell wall biosynthesis